MIPENAKWLTKPTSKPFDTGSVDRISVSKVSGVSCNVEQKEEREKGHIALSSKSKGCGVGISSQKHR